MIPSEHLDYPSRAQGFQVEYKDFPPNKNELVSLINCSSQPPLISHGIGKNVEFCHDMAALNILKLLSEVDQQNTEVPRTGNGPVSVCGRCWTLFGHGPLKTLQIYAENAEIALKIWNFWYLQRTRESSGEEGRTLRGRHSRSHVLWLRSMLQQLLGPGGFAKHPWIHWETSRSMPPVTRCLVLAGFLFVCFGCFYYFFPCCVKEETERRPPSQTGSHKHFRTNPGNSGWRKALVWPHSWKHQRKSNASSSAGGPSWRALVHTSHGTHSHRCSLPKEIRILSFIIFFWLKWHYINFHLSFSIVSSYIAQFRNLSETDLISNLISTDHIPVYVVTHFYFPGLTQDHFSDAHCMPSGLAETVQLWCLSQFYKLGSFGILNLKWSFGSFSIFIFVNARGIKWTLIFKDC